MLDLMLAAIIILLILSFALSIRIQRIRIMKMNMHMKHELGKVERSLDDFKKKMPDLVDREKLDLEKNALRREIAALESKIEREEKRMVKVGKELESDKKSERAMLRTIAKLDKMVAKMRERLAGKKKPKPVKKAKPARKKKK
jgi:ATP/maltotriose-dependent transcriptional regulator MalT